MLQEPVWPDSVEDDQHVLSLVDYLDICEGAIDKNGY